MIEEDGGERWRHSGNVPGSAEGGMQDREEGTGLFSCLNMNPRCTFSFIN